MLKKSREKTFSLVAQDEFNLSQAGDDGVAARGW